MKTFDEFLHYWLAEVVWRLRDPGPKQRVFSPAQREHGDENEHVQTKHVTIFVWQFPSTSSRPDIHLSSLFVVKQDILL